MADTNKDTVKEIKELINSFDKVQLEGTVILLQALKAGDSWKTAVQKGVDYFRKAGREETAQELLDYYSEKWEAES